MAKYPIQLMEGEENQIEKKMTVFCDVALCSLIEVY
jgi:hypothetical protein